MISRALYVSYSNSTSLCLLFSLHRILSGFSGKESVRKFSSANFTIEVDASKPLFIGGAHLSMT